MNSPWELTRRHYRREVSRVLTEVEAGAVLEDDLAKLRNFCMVALILLGKVPEGAWRKSEKEAELAAWLHNEIEEEA